MASPLGQLAVQYLRKLVEDQTGLAPRGVNENSRDWAIHFLSAIRAFREEHPDTEARRAAKRFGLALAKDRYRCFWEFWQNAEDAEASSLRFLIRDGELVVENDGKPFSSRDVYSVCFVASTQKEGDISQKGQFGIGLLSLMRISTSPGVHSGPFHFRLERDYTYPGPLECDDTAQGTRIIAPLCDEVDPLELRENLLRRLEENEEVLLYMSHLRSVEVVDEVGGTTKRIQCHVDADEVAARQVRLGEARWLWFRAVVDSPPGLKREDGEPVADQLSIVLARSDSAPGPHRLCAFFPTALLHNLPWRFSAPFEVTANREQLADSEYNRWLLGQVGLTMVDAALHPSIGNPREPWKLIPGRSREEPELKPLYEAADGKLRSIAWIPTVKGTLPPDRVAIPASAELRRLMKPEDVDDQDVSGRAWIRGAPESSYVELLMSLGASFVCCHELSALLASGPRRDPVWYLRAAAETIRLAEDSQWGSNEPYARLREGRCFKDRFGRPLSLERASQDGKVICSARSEHLAKDISRIASQRLVMLHSVYRTPEKTRKDARDELRERVHAWLRRQSSEWGFKYGYRLDAPQFIRYFIADASEEALDTLDDKAHDWLLSFLRDHLDAYVSAYKYDDRLQDIGQKVKVAAFSHSDKNKRVNGRRILADVYLGKSYAESPWAHAAAGVPGIWWLSAKYRKLLARGGEVPSVSKFLRELGAREVPLPTPIPEDSTHGTHRFTHVTRGDKRRYPHYPHDGITRWYSEYGMRGDHICADIDACLDFWPRLPAATRMDRGRALLRTLERHWDILEPLAHARAYAYYSNGEYFIDTIPARWLYNLRTRPWMRFADNSFRAPEGQFAGSQAVHSVLGTRDPNVCTWECENEDVAKALGLMTTVPAVSIIERLRRARRQDVSLSVQRATAYYIGLAKLVDEDPDTLKALKREDIIYSPTKARTWWRPTLCLTTDDQNPIFGERRAYLVPYREASALWRLLGIEDEPTLANLVRLWHELSSAPPDQDTLFRLERSYRLADTLCRASDDRSVVPVWTDDGWVPSDRVVATTDEELWAAVEEFGLPRWKHPNPATVRDFCRWAQITLIEQAVEYGPPRQQGRPSDIDRALLKSAVKRYAKEAALVNAALWATIAEAAKSWMRLQVVRVDSLEAPATVELPGVGRRELSIRQRAAIHMDTLYLSSVTRICDPETVSCLVRNIALAPSQAWNVENGLRVKLMEVMEASVEGPIDETETLPPAPSEAQEVSEVLFGDEDTVESEEESGGAADEEHLGSTEPPAAVTGIDDYEVASDARGDQPALIGGPSARSSVEPRPPGKPRRATKRQRKASTPAARKVEERGLDLLVEYVLEPEGIRISDQRLRPGVGADLYCSDRVFRELKTFSGRAPDRIKLSKHEQARALVSEDHYELVVVEDVWSEPVITIIPNPMRHLSWRPTGDVEVLDWREKSPGFRVVNLRRRTDNPDGPSD